MEDTTRMRDYIEIEKLKLENERLRLAAQNLWVTLQAVTMNIDVSTIRPGKRNTERWGDLRVRASEVLTVTRGVVKP
jgi:hypothetical protein